MSTGLEEVACRKCGKHQGQGSMSPVLHEEMNDLEEVLRKEGELNRSLVETFFSGWTCDFEN